ncbi:MAG: YobA family protein [Firmicutes bacterium]|nr:YobA family protein [Bacillota bacterium]
MTRKLKKAALILALAMLCVLAASCMDSGDDEQLAGDKDLDWQGAASAENTAEDDADTTVDAADDESAAAETTEDGYIASTGRIVKTDKSYFFVFESDNSFASMSLRSDDTDFDDLATGDLVKIGTDGYLMESYPMQMNVYSVELLERGSADDIDESVISEIESCGHDVIE